MVCHKEIGVEVNLVAVIHSKTVGQRTVDDLVISLIALMILLSACTRDQR